MSLTQMSISAGVLVIAIVLIRAVGLNRLPKTTFLVLWGVALFRLLVPVAIPARFSFYSAFREILSNASSGNTATDTAESGLYWLVLGGEATRAQSQGAVAQGQAFSMPWDIIWLVGMFALAIVFAVIYFKSHRGFRFAMLIRDNDFLNKWLAGRRLMRPIAIMQTDRILTPVAVGLIRPRIILPKCVDISDTQLLSHILIHEYYHIRRLDALWKILLVCAVCIHWFNPLVWVMFVLASRDLELTCDELVIRHFGTETETKTAYAYSIIGMAERRNKFASLLYNGFSKNAAEERIKSIMKMRRKSIMSLSVAIILVTVLTVGTLTVLAADRQADKQETLPTRSVVIHNADGSLSLNESEVLMGSLDNVTTENLEALNDLLAEMGMYVTQTVIKVTDGDMAEMRSFGTLEELRERFGEDITFYTSVSWMSAFDADGIVATDWEFGDSDRFSIRVSNSDEFGIRFGTFHIDESGMRSFESLDGLREYFGEIEVKLFSATGPVLPDIYGMDEFVIFWKGEYIDLLSDQEIYAMILDGATMGDIVDVLVARLRSER